MFSLPNYLKTQGYQTAAVHCFWAKYWSRDTAYPNLGLDTFLSLEKMTHVNKVRRHYWTSGLVTDDSMADQIIQQYESMKLPPMRRSSSMPSRCRITPIIIRTTTPTTSVSRC